MSETKKDEMVALIRKDGRVSYLNPKPAQRILDTIANNRRKLQTGEHKEEHKFTSEGFRLLTADETELLVAQSVTGQDGILRPPSRLEVDRNIGIHGQLGRAQSVNNDLLSENEELKARLAKFEAAQMEEFDAVPLPEVAKKPAPRRGRKPGPKKSAKTEEKTAE